MESVISKKEKDLFEKELDILIKEKRIAVIKKIKQARDLGDLSENDEYSNAKAEQGIIESRIEEVQSILNNSKLLKVVSKDEITLGSIIKAHNQKTKKTILFGINVEIANGIKITSDSPAGKVFLGKKIGDIVEIEAPNGATKFKIRSIE